MDTFSSTTKPSAEPPASVRNGRLKMPENVGPRWGTLHIAGKVWSLKMGSQPKKPVLNAEGDPMTGLPVVIVDVSPTKSKAYYADGFKVGENNPPDCASATAILPDPASPKKQNQVCATCSKNQIGSGKTAFGKACPDFRRIAIVPQKNVANTGMGGVPIMLRVPADSLKNLEAYLTDCQAIEVPFYTRVVKLKFDTTTHPKIVFEPTGYIDEAQVAAIEKHRENPITKEMLSERLKIEGEAQEDVEGGERPERPPEPEPVPEPAPNPATTPARALNAKEQMRHAADLDRLRRVQDEAAEAKAEAAKAAAAKPEPAPNPEPAADEPDEFDALLATYGSDSKTESLAAAATPEPEALTPKGSVDDEGASTGTDLDAMFDSLVTTLTPKKG